MHSCWRRGIPWLVAGLAAGLVALTSGTGDPALGTATTVQVTAPGTASVGETVVVSIDAQDVTGLGGYEWILSYDPAVLDLVDPPGNPLDGPFLGSSGRPVFCPSAIIDEVAGTVRFSCVTSGQAQPPGATGSGVLSYVSFSALANGGSLLCLTYQLTDIVGEATLAQGLTQDSIGVGGAPAPTTSCTPPTPPPPPPPGDTPVPPPSPTTAPPPPSGPTPTPAPTPPPEQSDWVDLAATCNPVTVTYPDGTTVQTLASATSPSSILGAMWAFRDGVWRAYSPQYPQASDLATTSFLEVVFFCVYAPGTFVRPLV
jgi:hypothetical protein